MPQKRKKKSVNADERGIHKANGEKSDGVNILITFTSEENMCTFCEHLQNGNIPFELEGFNAVGIAKIYWDELPREANKFFKHCEEYGTVTAIFQAYDQGERYMPNEEQAEDLLNKFADEL
jgi:hypothetical protein